MVGDSSIRSIPVSSIVLEDVAPNEIQTRDKVVLSQKVVLLDLINKSLSFTSFEFLSSPEFQWREIESQTKKLED